MVALKIDDLKEFTKKLFLGDAFDGFLVREAEIVTFNSFSIDGKVRDTYYSEDEKEMEKIERYSAWKKLKPFCFSLIKGNRLPERFVIILQLSQDSLKCFLQKSTANYSPEQVNGLYINIRYEEKVLSCVTGTSLNQFTLDKSLEHEWDDAVRTFLKKEELGFEER